jgi:DNA-binding transcriptional MerR regulator
MTMQEPRQEPIHEPDEWTIDELAQRAATPVRTIREYQTMGLLPPPEKRGRVGIYRPSHLTRLVLVARLAERGYSLAGIRDLLSAWRDGADLGEVLGLAPDQLVHVDEPGAPATRDQLTRALPGLVPDRFEELLASGVVEACGPDRYCVPSPSLLQLIADSLAAGYAPERVLELIGVVGRASAAIADATVAIMSEPPEGADPEQLVAFAARGRGLLAHGMGRLTVHALGRRLGITDEASVPGAIRSLVEADGR